MCELYIEKRFDKKGRRVYWACGRDETGDVREILETQTKKTLKRWVARYRVQFDWSKPYAPHKEA
mgnify:CR=1 FL=1